MASRGHLAPCGRTPLLPPSPPEPLLLTRGDGDLGTDSVCTPLFFTISEPFAHRAAQAHLYNALSVIGSAAKYSEQQLVTLHFCSPFGT